MADVSERARGSLEKRLRELEPFIKEHAQVREALDALARCGQAGAGRRGERGAARTNCPGKQRHPGAPGRPRGTGGRAQEVLKLVHQRPGITLAELAKRMKIQPNYLYRVLPHLVKDGKVTKREKGYRPQKAEPAGNRKEAVWDDGGRSRGRSTAPLG